MKKMFYFLDRIEEYFLVSCVAFMTILVFIQVVMRYVFQNSLTWSEELARYLFLWLSWVGASFAVRERTHFRVQMFIDKLPAGARKSMEVFILMIWFSFSVFLAYQGMKLASILLVRNQLSPAMQVPIGYAYASVPVGALLMAVRVLIEMIKINDHTYFKKEKDPIGDLY